MNLRIPFLMSFSMALFGATATSVGPVAIAPAPFTTPIKMAVGTDTSGTTHVYNLGRNPDGSYAIMDDQNNSLVKESSLPGGKKLIVPASSNSAFVSTFGMTGGTLYFIAFDALAKDNGVPVMTVMSWTAKNGLRILLNPGGTQFQAVDPTTGSTSPVTFTYVQMQQGMDISSTGTVTVLAVASTPNPQLPVESTYELFFLQWSAGATSWQPIFNNAVSAKANTFSATGPFCTSSAGSLYMIGQLTATAPTGNDQNQLAAYRMVAGAAPLQVSSYAFASGKEIACLSNGAQIYTADATTNAYIYAYVADSSSTAVPFFAGASVDSKPLSQNDQQFPVGPSQTYVITGDGSIAQISGSQGNLLFSQAGGVQMLMSGTNTILVSQVATNTNQAFNFYYPQISTDTFTGRPGDTVTISGSQLDIEEIFPGMELSIGGQPVPYAVGTNAITFTIPQNASPGNYSGTISAESYPPISLPFALSVQSANAPANPNITAVTNTASGSKGPFAPRTLVNIWLDPKGSVGPKGSVATGSVLQFKNSSLGTISAKLDSTPLPLVYNSGDGQLIAVITADAAKKTQGNVTVSFTDKNGNTAVSAPVTINLAPTANNFYADLDLGGGDLIPVLVDASGASVGSNLSPASAGSTVTAYGDGCGMPSPDPGDGKDVTTTTPVTSPTIVVGGVTAKVSSTNLVAGYMGLCAYQFTIPIGTSGSTPIWFGGNQFAAVYFWVK